MGFLDVARDFDVETLILVIYWFIPYGLDLEILGIIPGVRDVMPAVDPIYILDLSWTERGRLAVFIVLPYVDGEALKLFGVDLRDVIAD